MNSAPSRHPWTNIPIAAAFVASAAAGPYDTLPLRSNLSPLPYFATEGGRENKRFAGAEINRYHLYDFYRRQAAFELASPTAGATTLPPFPGLDGGRRGHWGVTNETDTVAYDRKTGPDFGPVTGCKGGGELFLLTGTPEDPGVLVFDSVRGGLKSAYFHGRFESPRHPLGSAVDRFGFNLAVQGPISFNAGPAEWTRAGKAAARFAGYYPNGSSPVFQWEIGAAVVLDQPAIISSADDGTRCLVRNIEFLSAVEEALEFALPVPAAAAPETPGEATVSHASDGTVMVRRPYGNRIALHFIRAEDGLSCDLTPGGAGIALSRTPAHGRLAIGTWVGAASEEAAGRAALGGAPRLAGMPKPSATAVKSIPRFPATVTVSGRLNADPEAGGTTYEMDDIPVPSENPYRTAMTLSGLAFGTDGTAYVCTLVGDVWKVTGLEGNLSKVVWKRYASGLDLPMGITVVDGAPYVNVRPHILALRDSNGDGEADYYERFNRVDLPASSECGRDLQRDASGNFYFNTDSAIYRLSADGKALEQIGLGARNPLGLAVRNDGLALSDSSEGNIGNGTCTIFESDHPENTSSVSKLRRILYLPRGVDNSPGSRIFMDEPRFGPLGQGLLGTSFGSGTWYCLLRDVADGTPQAALVPMPGSFSSGACRISVQPRDGQVFVAGLDGWGDYGVTEGCLHRLRYTKRNTTRISGWEACRNGIVLHFDHELAATPPPASGFFVQQWNYVDSSHTYGSPEYSVRTPDAIGHDRVSVTSTSLSPDRRSLFLATSSILPAMCTQVSGAVQDTAGASIPVELYATINRLRQDSPSGPPSDPAKASLLVVQEKDQNGDTYLNHMAYFDRLAGRDSIKREVAAEIPYRKEDLNYRWLKENLLNRQCMPCHGPGTQHDLSTYEGILRKINLNAPDKSPLHGMVTTGSIPPYPLPAVAPGMHQAVIDWIKAGAPQ